MCYFIMFITDTQVSMADIFFICFIESTRYRDMEIKDKLDIVVFSLRFRIHFRLGQKPRGARTLD